MPATHHSFLVLEIVLYGADSFLSLTAGCEGAEYDRDAVLHPKGGRVHYRTVRDARIS